MRERRRRPTSELRVARVVAGIQQQAIADAIGRHRSFVWRLETGRPARVNPVIVAEIARMLGRRPEELFEEVPE